MFSAVQIFLSQPNRTNVLRNNTFLCCTQNDKKEENTPLLQNISIPPNWKKRSLTRAKWDQEELFCSAFIFLMNLSLLCGDCPESSLDLLEKGMLLATLQTRRGRGAEVVEKNKIKSCILALWCWAWKCTMWCLHCKKAERLQILSGLVCFCFLMSDSFHNKFPWAFKQQFYLQPARRLFLTWLRPGLFLSHWSQVHLPSLPYTCQENR